jgi:hypothetical protein
MIGSRVETRRCQAMGQLHSTCSLYSPASLKRGDNFLRGRSHVRVLIVAVQVAFESKL